MMANRCLYPFTNITINTDGSASPCCKYNIHSSGSVSELHKNTLFTHDIEQLFYQPEMEKIRQRFLNDEKPIECKACWDEESAGFTSMRQHREKLTTLSFLKQRYAGKYNDPQIITCDFKFSSLCNLKCRICGPYCSSNWLKESLDTGGYNNNVIKIFSTYSERKFINNEKNFDIFRKILPNLHIIEFYGGEPLIQPEHEKIMEILRDAKSDYKDQNLQLFYNTNGTIFNLAFIETWNKMRNVELNISIDDIKNRFEYQRYPAEWLKVKDNIIRYITSCAENVQIRLYCTVSLYNIFYIDELIRYNAKHFKLPIRFNMLNWPRCMSITHLSIEIKNIIREKFASLTSYETNFVDEVSNIQSVVNFMMSNDTSADELSEFFKITSRHDRYRKQSFANVFPKYQELLNEYS